MARVARLVIPGYPHHITQRGVRSIDVFADNHDRFTYLQIMAEESAASGVTFVAWCLMSNHVHLIAVPEHETSLARAIGETHRRYTRMKNFREGVRGYLFQGRFGSCVLDQQHLLAAARYVECNPIAAGMASSPLDFPWSSARYHCGISDEDLLIKTPLLPELVDNWAQFLQTADEKQDRLIFQKTKTGRPVGGPAFIEKLEQLTGRVLKMKAPGRPSVERK